MKPIQSWYLILLLLFGIGRWPVMAENAPVRVMPTSYANMYEMYEKQNSRHLNTLITSDSVLHTAHVLFDYTLRAAELQRFDSNIRLLTVGMADAATAKAQRLDFLPVLDRAIPLPPLGYTRVAAYFWVARKLLNPQDTLPEVVRPLAEAELALIQAHDHMALSPIMGTMEDYTQYVPRGHYTRNEQFQRYFLAMMWYGRAGFAISGEKSPGVPLSAEDARANALAGIVLSRMLPEVVVPTGGQFIVVQPDDLPPQESAARATAQVIWNAVYQPTEFIVGQSDDLTPPEFAELSTKIFGATLPERWTPAAIATTDRFIAAARTLRPPKILGTLQTDATPGAPVALRLMGQRFIPDSAMFEQLVHPRVAKRFMPSGLDIMAVLGARQAEAMLHARGDFTKYPQYAARLTALRQQLATMPRQEWSATAYMLWLNALRALTADARLTDPQAREQLTGLPEWWGSEAWQQKQVNAGLGSWAELRHDTLLYAKQSSTLMMSAIFAPPAREPDVYVEPVAPVYGDIATLMTTLQAQLDAHGVFPAELKTNFADFTALLQSLARISNSEVQPLTQLRTPLPPTPEDWARVRNIGAILHGVETLSPTLRAQLTGKEDAAMALIADVHTDPNTAQVLEVGVGNVASVTVTVQTAHGAVEVAGPIFSYYEFPQPLEKRLTDAQWQQMLSAHRQPAPLVLQELLK